jgi:hypothetical protein
VTDDRLATFDKAVREFRETSYDMNGPVGGVSGSDHTLRARAGQTAYDVFSCCETFRLTYVRVHDEMRERLSGFEADFAEFPRGENVPEEVYEAFWADFRERQETRLCNTAEREKERERILEEMDSRMEGRDATAAFSVAFKALYLFVRAHQDSLCALICLVQQPRATRPVEYNMTEHLGREGGLVQSFIRAEVPDYHDWYMGWRDARNKIKRGVNFGISGNAHEFGISFSVFIPESGRRCDRPHDRGRRSSRVGQGSRNVNTSPPIHHAEGYGSYRGCLNYLAGREPGRRVALGGGRTRRAPTSRLKSDGQVVVASTPEVSSR